MAVPGGGYVAFAPEKAMPLCPLPVSQRPGGTGQFHVWVLETQADVQPRVLRLDGEHLAAILVRKMPFGFDQYPVWQAKVWGVGGFNPVGQGLLFVVELQAPLV